MNGSEAPTDLRPDRQLGPYQITSRIGAGGMGEVYRARDPRLGRDVAVKVLPSSFAQDPDAVNTWAGAINNSGVVVGTYQTPAPEWLGFVLERGRFTDFRVPDASWTNPYFINDRGQISGTYGDAKSVAHGFVATPVHGR
jgi:serine/threonine protein kinase